MSDRKKFGNLLDYARSRLLRQMIEDGFDWVEIEAMIAAMPDSQPLKVYFALQFIELLPKSKRKAAKNRLFPKQSGIETLVVLTTFTHQPKVSVPAGAERKLIDEQIERLFGRQENGRRHQWHYALVE